MIDQTNPGGSNRTAEKKKREKSKVCFGGYIATVCGANLVLES